MAAFTPVCSEVVISGVKWGPYVEGPVRAGVALFVTSAVGPLQQTRPRDVRVSELASPRGFLNALCSHNLAL